MSVSGSPGRNADAGLPGKTNAGTERTSMYERVRNGYGRCGYIIIGGVWHASLHVQREGWGG